MKRTLTVIAATAAILIGIIELSYLLMTYVRIPDHFSSTTMMFASATLLLFPVATAYIMVGALIASLMAFIQYHNKVFGWIYLGVSGSILVATLVSVVILFQWSKAPVQPQQAASTPRARVSCSSGALEQRTTSRALLHHHNSLRCNPHPQG
jgi:hypothetical protein